MNTEARYLEPSTIEKEIPGRNDAKSSFDRCLVLKRFRFGCRFLVFNDRLLILTFFRRNDCRSLDGACPEKFKTFSTLFVYVSHVLSTWYLRATTYVGD